jgi:hypothetical protein
MPRSPETDKTCGKVGRFSLQDILALHPLKRCHPRGSVVNNDVKRRTGTKKYIDSTETQ